jgi:hypothetical protein
MESFSRIVNIIIALREDKADLTANTVTTQDLASQKSQSSLNQETVKVDTPNHLRSA